MEVRCQEFRGSRCESYSQKARIEHGAPSQLLRRSGKAITCLILPIIFDKAKSSNIRISLPRKALCAA